jgi:site-specific DNA recombinase
MRLIGYVRVSTEEQAQSGLGLESQQSKIQAYCDLYGHELVQIVTDAGQSAKSLNRPGIKAALGSLSRGEADGLVIFKLDRLSRNVSDMGSLIDTYFTEKAGKALLSVSDQIDTTTAGGRLVLNVLMSVAQWEREAIGERTAAALESKARRGEIKGGAAPIGKQWADKAHVDNENELEAVKIIQELRESGLSMRAIVDELNRRNVPVTRKGGKWHLTTVARILSRAS